MKKRDKLYTVNKWNRNQFCGGGHKFSGLDELTGKMNQAVTYTSPSLASVAGGINLPKTIISNGPQVTLSPTQKFNAITSNFGSGTLGALGAASTLVNQLGTKLISDGYSTGGIGEGIGTAGAAIGDIVSQINPVAGMIVKGASGIVGGVVNRGFGTKKNDKNINIIQTNTADARNAGNLLASSTTSDALLNSAGSMTTSSNFDTRDLVKGGWFAKGKAKKQGQKYITAEDSALAYQNHGMTIGADKVDNNIDNTAQSNFIYATGGPLSNLVKPGIKTLIEEAKKTSAERTAPDWINWNLNDIANAIVGKGKKKKGKFSKGEFGGGGAGTKFGESWLPYSEVKRDTIWLPVEETFNDAFARARKAGLKEFDFDGKKYSTEIGDNPDNYSAGQRRTQAIGAIPIPVEYEQDGTKRASDMTNEEFNAAMAEREAELKAFGGPLDYLAGGDMGAINYGFMTDYLTTKKKQAEASNKVPGISPMANTFGEGGIEIKHPGRLTRLKERTGKTEAELWAEGRPEVRKMITFARNARKWSKALGGKIERDGVTIPDNVFCGGGKMFALGGDIQMNGADFTNGMQHINAGNSHEENPYEGVQVGVDPQGVPNLVEEGEVIYNDYVYSNRIPCDDETKAKFRLSKKRDITYADLAKRLEKESLERPNDPISKAALKKQMENLANEQERQKQEMEAQRAKEAFEALSPEEQITMMQQASQQEQMAQEQAMQEQQVPEEAMAQQPTTPEQAQQQQIMAQQMAVNPQMANMSAYGGPVNKFLRGGETKTLAERIKEAADKAREAGQTMEETRKARVKEVMDKANEKQLKININWLKAHHPELSANSINIIASLMLKEGPANNPSGYYKNLIPTLNFSDKNMSKYFNRLTEAGIDAEDAWQMIGGNEDRLVNNPIEQERLFNYIMKNSPAAISTQSDAPSAAVQPEGMQPASYNITSSATPYGPPPYNPGLTAEAMADLVDVPMEDLQNLSSEEVEYLNSLTSEQRQAIVKQIENTTQDTPTVEPKTSTQQVQPPSVQTQEVPPITTSSTSSTPAQNVGNNIASDNRRVYNTGPSGSRIGASGLRPYAYYTNGTDGYSTPTGFKVGNNGRAFDYTDEYRNLVSKLTADDIRKWAAEHPNDVSLKSFIARGNDLSKLTDEQWRRGALDGKYGFMHHVTDQILNSSGKDENAPTPSPQPTAPTQSAEAVNQPDSSPLLLLDENGNYTEIDSPTDDMELIQEIPEQYGNMKVYKRKPASVKEDVKQNTDEPEHRPEWLRYVGLFGPAVGLGMQALGIGRPNTKAFDAVLEGYDKRGAATADYRTIGDYLTYRPMDIWAEQNRMNANARATDRAIQNNAAPIGTQMAGLLASNYNDQNASGQLYRQALEYNDNLRRMTGEFNRGTNQFNAQAYNQAALQNAEIRNRDRQIRAQLGMQAAAQKADMDAGWYNGIYGNISNLFKGIGEIGRENGLWNMNARLVADKVVGNGNSYTEQPYLKSGSKEEEKRSKGGKLKRKRGLTF